MSPIELEQLMKDCAEDAVATAQEEFSLTLDYSAESVSLVDDILLSFLDKYHDSALEDEAVFTICNIFGAYVGETFQRFVGGTWLYDQSNPKAPYVLLVIGENSYAFAGICYERLVNDSQVSVKAYFDQSVSNHRQ